LEERAGADSAAVRLLKFSQPVFGPGMTFREIDGCLSHGIQGLLDIHVVKRIKAEGGAAGRAR
jgi:hypothetical protein